MMADLFNKQVIDTIRYHLLTRHETVAAAESVTSGLMQTALSLGDDAAKYFQGGITTYNLGQKSRQLDIDPIHAFSCNCVSAEVAAGMAANVSKLFTSDWGTGITGYATPVLESGNELFAFYAIAHKGAIVKQEYLVPQKDDPFNVQLFYVNELLKGFLSLLRI